MAELPKDEPTVSSAFCLCALVSKNGGASHTGESMPKQVSDSQDAGYVGENEFSS